jgi:hypothetical protein
MSPLRVKAKNVQAKFAAHPTIELKSIGEEFYSPTV